MEKLMRKLARPLAYLGLGAMLAGCNTLPESKNLYNQPTPKTAQQDCYLEFKIKEEKIKDIVKFSLEEISSLTKPISKVLNINVN